MDPAGFPESYPAVQPFRTFVILKNPEGGCTGTLTDGVFQEKGSVSFVLPAGKDVQVFDQAACDGGREYHQ